MTDRQAAAHRPKPFQKNDPSALPGRRHRGAQAGGPRSGYHNITAVQQRQALHKCLCHIPRLLMTAGVFCHAPAGYSTRPLRSTPSMNQRWSRK